MATALPPPADSTFEPIPPGTAVVPVETGVIEDAMAVFGQAIPGMHQGKPLGFIAIEYLGNKEIYGKEYITGLVLRQAMELAKQGSYVFVHGQSLSHAARTEKNQQPHARALGDTSGSIWGERRMALRTPDTGANLPANAEEYSRHFSGINDDNEPHRSALMSVDFMFKNTEPFESAFFFCDPSMRVYAEAPPAFHALGGRYYLFVVDPGVIRDSKQNFVYRSGLFGVPDEAWSGRQAMGLKPNFVTDCCKQARFVMQGYMQALMNGQVRVFVYDTLSYAQRRWYQAALALPRPLPAAATVEEA